MSQIKYKGQTDGRTDGVKPIYPPNNFLCGGYNNIDDLVQDYSHSSALAMELLQSCTKPAIWNITEIRLVRLNQVKQTKNYIQQSGLDTNFLRRLTEPWFYPLKYWFPGIFIFENEQHITGSSNHLLH